MNSTLLAATLPALLLLGVTVAEPAPAAARDNDVTATATVEWAYRPRDRVAADQILWRCSETQCVGAVNDHPASHLRACRRLARAVGTVTRYESSGVEMPAENLARCNPRR